MATESQTVIETAQFTRVAQFSRLRIFSILLTAFVIMIIATAVCFGFLIHSWEGILENDIQRNLTEKARMFANEVNNEHARGIAALTSQQAQLAGARATVIDMNGKVIADSEVRVSELESEGRAPEFAAALHGDTGVQVRSHSAFGIPVMYVAVPVSGGAVRLAYPVADVATVRAEAHRTLFWICAVAFCAALVISTMVAGVYPRPLR